MSQVVVVKKLRSEAVSTCSELAPHHLPAALATDDGTLTPEGWGALASAISSIVCFVLYKNTRGITASLIPTYKHLSREDKRNWDSRYSSNIHAAACVYFGYLLLWKSDFFWKDDKVPMFLRTCEMSYLAMGISFGYFAVDMVSCFKYNMGGTEMMLHHLGSLLAVTTALVTGDGHMPTLWMLVTEFTTPLINNRWWLDKMDLKDHISYVINGLSILLCWIPARLAVFPPFFWVLWQHKDQIKLLGPLSQLLCVTVPVILTLLNVYWFTKICRGAYKVLFTPKKTKQA